MLRCPGLNVYRKGKQRIQHLLLPLFIAVQMKVELQALKIKGVRETGLMYSSFYVTITKRFLCLLEITSSEAGLFKTGPNPQLLLFKRVTECHWC